MGDVLNLLAIIVCSMGLEQSIVSGSLLGISINVFFLALNVSIIHHKLIQSKQVKGD